VVSDLLVGRLIWSIEYSMDAGKIHVFGTFKKSNLRPNTATLSKI
jgi:hypothetical protein